MVGATGKSVSAVYRYLVADIKLYVMTPFHILCNAPPYDFYTVVWVSTGLLNNFYVYLYLPVSCKSSLFPRHICSSHVGRTDWSNSGMEIPLTLYRH